MRAVIYARYSSDLQREASIGDQIEVCRRYAEAQGWSIVGTYKDAAISGASRFRPGFQKLMADAAERRFDLVICEAIDRLGRRLADTADLQDQLTFQGIRLYTPSLGEITHIHVAVMGMMAQMALKDLGEKTNRGQLGRVLKGRIPAGNRLRLQNRGCRRRRAGRATDRPRRGRRRSADLQGIRIGEKSGSDRARPQPRTCAGTCRPLVVEHDDSRPVRSRHRDPEQRSLSRRHRMEPLRLYEKPKDRKTRRPSQSARTVGARRSPGACALSMKICGSTSKLVRRHCGRRWGSPCFERKGVAAISRRNRLNEARTPRFLLSGLLRCGCCNGPYAVIGRDRYACSTRKQKGTCENRLSITRQEIEARVLEGLKERLLAPDLVAVFVKAFPGGDEAPACETLRAEPAHRERKAAELDRKIAAIFRAIEDGLYEPAMKTRLAELKEQRDKLRIEKVEDLTRLLSTFSCIRSWQNGTGAEQIGWNGSSKDPNRRRRAGSSDR